MRRLRTVPTLLLLTALLLPGVLPAADPPLTGPAEIKQNAVGVFTVRQSKNGRLILTPPADLSVKKSRAGDEWFVAGPPGTYRLTGSYFSVDFEAKTWDVEAVDFEFRITGVAPPVPPVPPGPTPPVPPGPVPPGPNPIPLDGFRVMVFEESADRSRLTPGQRKFLFAEEVRTYLVGHCATNPAAGGKKDWWILDKDLDVSGIGDHWKAVKARGQKSYPWIVVGNGAKGGYEGPLPDRIEDAMNLLKKYGGE